MVIEWLAFTIIFLGILIYKITDRYFEYKEHISKIEKSKEWYKWFVLKKNGIVVELKKWVVNGCAYNEESKEDIEELKRLFYSDRLTQNGKRKLIRYYEKRIKQLEEENVELRIENSAMDTVLEDLKARLL